MITIYWDDNLLYQSEQLTDPKIQQACQFMAYQQKMFGQTQITIDWGDEKHAGTIVSRNHTT